MAAVLGPFISSILGGAVGGSAGSIALGVVNSLRRGFNSLINNIRRVIVTFMRELRKFVSFALRYLPVGGIFAVSMWLILCNAGIIPCEKPQSLVMLPMSVNMFTPPKPSPPPPPLEFTRPKYDRTGVSMPQLMAEAVRPGFTVVKICPWLLRRSRPVPLSLVGYSLDEFVVLGRKTTQMG